MNKVQQYEKERFFNALNKLTEFLNYYGTHVEMTEITPIGKKYTAVNGHDKKEIYLTKGNTVITSFFRGEYVNREVVFHDNIDVKSAIDTMISKLEKGASDKNLKTKLQYYWKRFKELQRQ